MLTGKKYAKAHGGNIGLEKAFIAGQREVIERIRYEFSHHTIYNSYQAREIIDKVAKTIDERT